MKAMAHDHLKRRIAHRRQHDMATMAKEIAGHIPRMWLRSPSEDDFWRWFCGELQSVVRNAGDIKEKSRLHARLLAALSRAGLPQPPSTFQRKC
ncbi:MAG TPA: hypothetical protein VF471_15700 [Pseudoxanthomonas sp.]